ncbi:hypothetical protein A2801_03370 [Candidatus Woesebacteria bacterium RIFCSPHIGHO2_01_FULL_41_10]|uniref:HD domain-containing protein n=1 Tax=Candidatus Woesebacteria bacterium RIFCSPHIGHO2_01_FULL_41_10 TaxID=1802500 RepID=A0A1F7YP88_9BACT|nr:MAG: hypothetical protein A2801_03370 [Candidatus Woesebacteria bacterium RIFCSPHIGHO2_01_FULL_41_10]
MNFSIPQEIKNLFFAFEKNGYQLYLVGGAVRDLLMDKEVTDWDFTTNATPDQILAIFPDAFYNNSFGTVGIRTEESNFKPHEITTFRTEQGYSDSRHPDEVKWGTSIEEDLERRDFTINAIALQYPNGFESSPIIIDPFDGQKDIEKKIIKAVGNPKERISEDALRMMRAVRIASELNFTIEEQTLSAIQECISLIKQIANERIRDEIYKILASNHSYEGFELLRKTGLLKEILPEVEECFGIEQRSPGRHHIYDVGTHCFLSLKYCKSLKPIVRFATLLHDVGKPQTYKKLPDGTITFYNHEIIGAKLVKMIAKRLRLSKEDTDILYKLVRWHQFTLDEQQSDKSVRRFIRNVGPSLVEDMLELRIADRLGGAARETSWRFEDFKRRILEVQKQPFTVHDLKLTGNDVMKILDIKPSQEVGKILNQLYEEVTEHNLDNNEQVLIQRLKEIKSGKVTQTSEKVFQE